MMLLCKNMRHLNGKTVPLVIGGGGGLVDAAWEVANMLRVDPVGSADKGSTPLFRDPATNQPRRPDPPSQPCRPPKSGKLLGVRISGKFESAVALSAFLQLQTCV